ncbi:MAG TPA: acyltransferase [Saprospiraceae bacterium]|nr:acyltransferase [Saprospiraceae bacterium]
MKIISGLNGLRALAVFLVIIAHWELLPLLGIYINKAMFNGLFGVDLFFVISGFLITSILLKSKIQIEEGVTSRKNAFINFYFRRILRIFPLYYSILFILYILKYPGFSDYLLNYLTYTENIGVVVRKSWDSYSLTWSLSVEEQFYLIWPLVIIILNRKYLLWTILLFIIIGPLFSMLQLRFFGNGFWFLTPSCFDSFGMGALISYFFIKNKTDFLFKIIKYLVPIAILLLYYWTVAENGGHMQYLKTFFNSIISMYLILICIGPKPKIVKNILECKILDYLGMVSYGLYLIHEPIPYFYHKYLSFNPFMDFIIMLFILITLAFMSYFLFEKYFLNLKKYFIDEIPNNKTNIHGESLL